jgi:hypothetical protein
VVISVEEHEVAPSALRDPDIASHGWARVILPDDARVLARVDHLRDWQRRSIVDKDHLVAVVRLRRDRTQGFVEQSGLGRGAQITGYDDGNESVRGIGRLQRH